MKTFKKILVPVDFSEHSAEAVRYAADLAQRYHASLTLAHVYDPVPYALPDSYLLFSASLLSSMMTEFQQQLDRDKQLAIESGAREVATTILNGIPSSEIVAHAAEHGFDLVVIGTHGRTGLKHVVLGSVAERVVRRAPCPVLTVRATETKEGDEP